MPKKGVFHFFRFFPLKNSNAPLYFFKMLYMKIAKKRGISLFEICIFHSKNIQIYSYLQDF
uniref:Uncharacterized protein n=1 Tax=viral metagenome TaxID=1070528 RepID=A0A6C0IJT2_9ZZZZ